MSLLRILLVASILLCSLTTPILSRAADIAQPHSVDRAVLQRTIERLSILYLIRASFDVMDPEALSEQLATDLRGLELGGLGDATNTALEESLMAEGSYYITSLRYLIEAGGANWPSDKAASTYDRESLETLAALQHEWLIAVVSDGDLYSLALAADQLNALTEGYLDVPPHLDHFSQYHRLVHATMAKARP